MPTPYCGSAADTVKPILREAPILRTGPATDTAKPTLYTSRLSEIARLCSELNLALRRPGRKSLTLINKALSYLLPFESPKASVTTPTERRDLLALLTTHRMVLAPYIDTDRIEAHLRYYNSH